MAEEQFDAFATPPAPPPRARATDIETSHQAAASMVEPAAAQRRKCLEVLREAGGRGMIHSEIDEALGWDAATANRRLHELRGLGLVYRRLDSRKTSRGRAARVYEITLAGIEALRG